jgi:hypothetical protein
VSADTIVPGAAEGAGGGLATIGYSDQTRLTPLTVGFHEPQFLEVLNAENQELLQFGPPALWDSRTRQEHNPPMGPANPQALNRHAYCLNNPLRYVDPTGHYLIISGDIEIYLNPDEVKMLLNDLDTVISWFEMLECADTYVEWGSWMAESAGILQLISPEFLAALSVLLGPEALILGGAAGLCASLAIGNTKDDLMQLRQELTIASENGKKGVTLLVVNYPLWWSISVNGKEVMGRVNTGNPILSPRGTLNATPQFMMVWLSCLMSLWDKSDPRLRNL